MNQHSIRAIARVAHEVNRGYCKALGDNSQVPWEEAAEWQQNSAVAGVVAILENTEMGPTELHNAWCREKWAQGWKYGPTKDADAKTHPCLVPYEDLSRDDKIKDYIFDAIVKSLMNNPPAA